MNKIEVGSTVLANKLSKLYGNHALGVLGNDYLELQQRNGKEHRKYKIIKELPSADEFAALMNKRYTVTVSDLVEDAFAEIDELANEMQEAYDNTPESLQESDIGQRRSQAADDLKSIFDDKPDTELATDITLVFINGKTSSRPKRASNAADMLNSASTAIHEWIAEQKDNEEIDRSRLEDLAETLEKAASDLEDVDFPVSDNLCRMWHLACIRVVCGQ